MLVCVLWFLFFRSSILFLISFREAVFPIECHINIYIYILVCSIFVSSWFAPHSLLSLPCALCNNAPMCGHHGSFLMCCFFFSLFYFSSSTLCALHSTLVNFLLASWFDMVVQLVLTINLIGFQSRKIALLSKM